MNRQTIVDSVFLHYFDTHFLLEKGYRSNQSTMDKELILATKLAYLFSNTLSMPASTYFENALSQTIFGELFMSDELFILELICNNSSLYGFFEEKILQYVPGSEQHNIYTLESDKALLPSLRTIRKTTNTTHDVRQSWYSAIKNDTIFHDIIPKFIPSDFRDRCLSLESLLGEKAYTPEYISSALLDGIKHSFLFEDTITHFINNAYFKSYIDAISNRSYGVVVDLISLYSTNMDDAKSNISLPFRHIKDSLQKLGLLDIIENTGFKDLQKLKISNDKILAVIANAIEQSHKKENAIKEIFTKSEEHMGKKFNIQAEHVHITEYNAEISGEVSVSHSFTKNNTEVDWKKVIEELQLHRNHENIAEQYEALLEAAQRNDANSMRRIFSALRLTRDFFVSISAGALLSLFQ